MKGWFIGALLVGGIILGIMLVKQFESTSKQRARAEAAELAIDSLDSVIDSLEQTYKQDTVRLTKWRTRWDTVKAGVDTVPVETIIEVADSTINACQAALSTCETRVARERERADSIESAKKAWERLAKGPWISPRLELTVTPSLTPQAALDLTLGRGRLKVLARAEVGDTAEVRAGLSWRP